MRVLLLLATWATDFLPVQVLPFLSFIFMDSLIWNCRGAGGRFFPGLIRDYIRMYSLNFVALLEPRISSDRADQVVNTLGMDGVTRVEATGFSGGIWCLWKSTSISVDVIHSMRFCVHLKINP